MSGHGKGGNLFRQREGHQHHRVTFVELFFDLVFVFAVTQLSHTLLGDFSLLGAGETVLLLLAVWWVWIYTSWVTNWLDPERLPVRLMIFALMLGGLALSISVPKAFDSLGLLFAVAYASMQIGRSLFMCWAIPRDDRAQKSNFHRIVIWFTVAGALWVAGALLHDMLRLAMWSVAVAIEYVAPSVRFWVPGLGASRVRDWTIEGAHLAERCALFIIIALGESVIMTGSTFASSDWSSSAIVAFLTSFTCTVAMWWIYFDKAAEFGSERIATSEDPGGMARLAYTYLHLPIVASIILSAVADELVLAHSGGHTDVKAAISLIGAPLLFLVGNLLFKRAVRGWFQLSHLVGIGALLATIPLAMLLSPLVLGAATTGVLVLTALWESLSLRKPARD